MFRTIPLSLSFLLFLGLSRGIAFGLLNPPTSSTLHSRQAMPISDIPSECQASCQSFSDITDICDGTSVDVNCLCSDMAANAILSCVNCIANLASTASTFRLQEQQTLDNLSTACGQAGHPFNTSLQVAPAQTSGASSILLYAVSSSQLLSIMLLFVFMVRI